VGIVHLGLGAFHRAHQAVYTQQAMAVSGETSWGICGVTQRSPAVAEALLPQDCLYTVLERGAPGTKVCVVGAIRDVLVAQDQPEKVTDRLARPETRVVTLTVTEKGYRSDPSTGRLRDDDPEVLADAGGRPPRTVVGQLVRGLEARWRRGSPSLTVLCCDNLPHNGDTLRGLVGDFGDLSLGSDAARLASWALDNVTFPNTMVDRIVPATTDEDRHEAMALLGLEDQAVVVTEPFSQWVVEDRFAGPRPAWDEVGATLVRDVAPYEEMKLRLLNGSHSALAYLGALAGYEFIADAVASPDFARFARAFMDVDVTPTLTVPPGFDLVPYKEALMGRFADRALRHRTIQIAMDGSQKLPYRLLRTIAARLGAGHEPLHACLAVAAWMRFVTVGRADNGTVLPLDDPMAVRLRAVAAGQSTAEATVAALLSLREVFPADLAANPTFRALLVEALEALSALGAATAVASIGRRPSTRPA
jgi:fructuronate reductase